MTERRYTSGVKAALQSLSGRRCYWPDCNEPVVRFVDGHPVNNLQIAHIIAAKRHGPRYIKMPDEERKSFSNLILLCHPHHTLVDKIEPKKYSIELLQEWKAQREGPEIAELRGVRELTEERLQEMITEAVVERDKRIDEALKHFEKVDFEAARILEEMLEELNHLRAYGAVLDPDMVSMLHGASARLSRSVNVDTVGELKSAASMLQRQNLHDVAGALSTVAAELSQLPELVVQLNHVARKLRRLQDGM